MIRNLKQILELVTLLWCMGILFGKEKKFGTHSIIAIVMNLIICEGINEGIFPKYFLVFIYVILFLYAFLFFGKNIKVTFLNCFLTVVVTFVLQMIVYLPVHYVLELKYGVTEYNDLFINVGSLIILFILSQKVKLNELSDFLQRKSILLVSIFIFIFACLGRIIYQIKKMETVPAREYILVLSFLFLFFFSINEWKKAKVDAERKKAQIEMNKLYYAAYDELIVLIRERQHDLKNHISALYGMIYTSDNLEELVQKQKEYCEFILGQNEETRLLLSSGNPLITGFMYNKIKEAMNKEIKVEYKIEMEKLELKMPEYEIIEILGILFDNAMEALEVQEVEKIIHVSIVYINGKLEISVANRSEEFSYSKIEEFFYWNFSTKGKGHGIGLTKLKKIVQENSGEIIVSNEKYESTNFLQFEICLPLCYE